jgi:uncharacterized protein with FMN-binding domain
MFIPEQVRTAMKKIALSLFVIAASGAYLWSESEQAEHPHGSSLPLDQIRSSATGRQGSDAVAVEPRVSPAPADQLGGRSPTGESIRGTMVSISEPTSGAVPMRFQQSLLEDAVLLLSPPDVPNPLLDAPHEPLPPALAIDESLPRSRPAHNADQQQLAGAIAVAARAYADGSYIGPAVDAYYGFVRIKVIVRGGRLVSVEVLEYPSDRRTSIFINRQALPMLRDEVVRAQSANVDIISGATLTSEAFIQSLDIALRRAES